MLKISFLETDYKLYDINLLKEILLSGDKNFFDIKKLIYHEEKRGLHRSILYFFVCCMT